MSSLSGLAGGGAAGLDMACAKYISIARGLPAVES